MKSIISIVMILCSLQAISAERIKEFERSFPGSSFKELTVSNRYGNVNITQGGNDLDVKVVVVVQAGKDLKAEEYLNYVNIIAEESGDHLNLKTMFDKEPGLFSNVSIDVEYRIKVPFGKKVRVVNREGALYLGDYKGDLSVDIESGNLKARSISEGVLSINLNKGEVVLPYVESMIGTFNSADVKIDDANDLRLDCKSTSLRIIQADDILIKSSGGDSYIGAVDNLDIHSSYTKFEVQDIVDKLRVDCSGGELNVRNINIAFTGVEIKSMHAKLGLTFMEGCGYQLTIRCSKSVKTDIPEEFMLTNKPTLDKRISMLTGFVGDRRLKGEVILNLSGGSIFIQ